MKVLGSWTKTIWNAKLFTSEAPSKRKGTESHEVSCIDPWVPQKGVRFPEILAQFSVRWDSGHSGLCWKHVSCPGLTDMG